MKNAWKVLPIAMLAVGVAGCNDFLTGGELSTDPNRPTTATSRQLFTGVQSNLWAFYASDMVRVTEMWAQQMQGNVGQYQNLFTYGVSEQTTNGFYAGLYIGGGLVDVRSLQQSALTEGDTLFLGIAQVQEALLMSVGADLFGDVVYSEALKGDSLPNPKLDPQLEVYDALLALLDQSIANMAFTGPTNVGPGDADLSYGGDPVLWTKLAHTLKARILVHTAEVRPDVWPTVLAEASQGFTDPSENFVAAFSGASGEQNFYYQFTVVQREGYWTPYTPFVQMMVTRGDPRLTDYFNATQSGLSAARSDPAYTQPLILANENLLVWAEAAYRTGDEGTAVTQLNAERALAGLPAVSPTGPALLQEILTEKYIATFQTNEGW
ncbi:MAG TPA: SusD/RagB family nutrient-binding outer membrane lipoprotein, partial [Gemmatimonadaceae bacterium]|nr:SusD/RagB family nutrient-binding outer membrane lipoprotein [Gemmatimonadaceae bacterium]